MTDKSPPEDKMLTDEEREANKRFQDTVGRLVNTPHKPHETMKKGREPKPAPNAPTPEGSRHKLPPAAK
jgi:hypothetical protein